MSTLLQYFRSSFRKRTPEKCYYICGNSPVGIEMVVADVIKNVRFSAGTPHIFSAVHDRFESFYEALDIKTIDTHLVILRDAEVLTEEQWARIQDWYGRSSTTILAIVTNEVMTRRTGRPERVEWFRTKGKFVECKKFSKRDSAKGFIQFYLDCTEVFADFFIDRVGFDTEKILEQLKLLRMTKTRNVREAVQIVPDTTSRNYVDMLYDRDPGLMKTKLTSQQIITFINDVEKDLVLQLRVLSMSRQNYQNFEMCAELDISPGYLNKLIKRAAKTTGNQMFARLDLVTKAQHYFNEYEARVGVQEWFIKRWRMTK